MSWLNPFIPTIIYPSEIHGMEKKRPAVPRRPRQELKDVGVSVEALDKEGLVQAMVQQLSWRGVLTTGEDMGGWNEVGIT